jgi:hypothetical protein
VKSAGLKAVGTFGTPEISQFTQKGLESNDFARGGEGSGAGFLTASRERKREKTTGWYGMIPLDFSPQLRQNERKTAKQVGFMNEWIIPSIQPPALLMNPLRFSESPRKRAA